MPTYAYECLWCGRKFTTFHGMTAAGPKFCNTCGGRVKRLISGGAGVIFKGTGFYETDYKRKGNKS